MSKENVSMVCPHCGSRDGVRINITKSYGTPDVVPGEELLADGNTCECIACGCMDVVRAFKKVSVDYLVTWAINVSAYTPAEAAARALAVQRDVNAQATVFYVAAKVAGGSVRIDTADKCVAPDASGEARAIKSIMGAEFSGNQIHKVEELLEVYYPEQMQSGQTRDALVDLLTDIMLYCDRTGYSFNAAHDVSLGHLASETKLLRAVNVAKLFDVSISTVSVWSYNGKLPRPYKHKGLLYWSYSDIVSFRESKGLTPPKHNYK